MKITEVKLYVLEHPTRKASGHQIVQVPNLKHRTQYTHKGMRSDLPLRQNFIEVCTDEGICGRMNTTIDPYQASIVRHHAVGKDPFHREALFQLLFKGTRWVYQKPGWFGGFDNCLWEVTAKAANLPVYALIGKVRDATPVYMTGGDMDLEGYLKAIEDGKQCGINAYKAHSYKGGKADLPIIRGMREAVGPDYVLLMDPVCSYSFREAVEVGHLMEELDYLWLEEPMHEQKMNLYNELCRELTIPVMGNEMLMHDMDISAQWLIQGATDRVRGNARHGTTQVLKLARLAELHNTNIELNGQGGLYGLVHAHVECCIDNTDYYEYSGSGSGDRNLVEGQQWGLMNAPLIVDGCIRPEDTPGWGAIWDEDKFQSMVVEVH